MVRVNGGHQGGRNPAVLVSLSQEEVRTQERRVCRAGSSLRRHQPRPGARASHLQDMREAGLGFRPSMWDHVGSTEMGIMGKEEPSFLSWSTLFLCSHH